MKIHINLNYSSTFKLHPSEIDNSQFLSPKRSIKMQRLYDERIKIQSCPKVLCKNAILMLMHIKNYQLDISSDQYGSPNISSINFFFKKKKKKKTSPYLEPHIGIK